jgi:ribosomal protein RSM22 (predicted rRNA methylase)
MVCVVERKKKKGIRKVVLAPKVKLQISFAPSAFQLFHHHFVTPVKHTPISTLIEEIVLQDITTCSFYAQFAPLFPKQLVDYQLLSRTLDKGTTINKASPVMSDHLPRYDSRSLGVSTHTCLLVTTVSSMTDLHRTLL